MIDELTFALREWADREKISPAGFAAKMGYSYQHAYNLLRGAGRMTDETLGRIGRLYGAGAVGSILEYVNGGQQQEVI